MNRSWKLGTAFGIGIYIHWTFLLLVGYAFYHYWSMGGSSYALHALNLLLAVFGCVVLHELGHALTARRFGIATRDITLYPIGGVARLERMSERPWEEFWIAVAGPAVNVVIAGILVVPVMLALQGRALTLEFIQTNFWAGLMFANVVLVLFNMLPAFPMDGGRVLRALLVKPCGRLQATQIAATIGGCFALVFVVLGLLWYPTFLLIGVFTFFAGQQELAAVRYMEWQRQNAPRDVILAEDVVDVLPVSNDEPFTGTVWDPQARAVVIWRNGQAVETHVLD